VAEYLRTLGAEIGDIKEVVANGYLRLCVKQMVASQNGPS